MFAALGDGHGEAIEVARSGGGTAFVSIDGQRAPAFSTLVLGEDVDSLRTVAQHGLYRVHVRRMRHQRRFWPAGAVSVGITVAFVLVRRPDRTHEETDEHWRDVHAPLALRHHPGMWHYHQISVDSVVHGPPIDGVALCAFASEQEFRERMFGDAHDREVITADVARFADMTASPRAVRMLEWRFGSD